MSPDPFALGRAHEASLDPTHRTRTGAWYTPSALARHLVEVALDRWDGPAPPRTVVDPAAGGGAFLLAAHERLPAARLRGRDCDPTSAAVARQALAQVGADGTGVTAGDGLEPGWATADLVLGNPPFLSQLGGATARGAGRRALLRGWWGRAADGYVDEAALFLLAATTMLRPGGVAVLILPLAVLATDGARSVREQVAALGRVEVVWRDGRDGAPVFPGTPTCAVAVVRDQPDQPARADRSSSGGRWGHLLADADGVPDPDVEGTRTLADVATATADFRDAYYTVAEHVAEHRPGHDDPRLAPVGLIDPAHHRWGEVSVRFAKRRWAAPVAVGLPADFLTPRLGPKVLVATQTRVLEALVDTAGDLLPTTPTITVRSERPWHVAAALTSPVATAVAVRRHAGAARSARALKLSARQVLDLPIPTADPTGTTSRQTTTAWDRAAEAVRAAHAASDPAERRAHLRSCARWMCTAHGLTDDADDLLGWWAARLPER